MPKRANTYANKNIVKRTIGGIIFLVLFFAVVFGTEAAGSSTASVIGGDESIYVTRYLPNILKGAQGPAEMIFLLYQYLIGLVGIVAVGTIIYAGVLRTMSASQAKIQQSNELIRNALKGIVLLFGAQVLFNTINPNIVDIPRIQEALRPKEKFTPAQFLFKDIKLPKDTSTSILAQQSGDYQAAAETKSGARAIYGENIAARTVDCTSEKGCTNGKVDLATKIKPCDGCVPPNFGEGNDFAVKTDGRGACFGGVDNCLVSTPLKGALDKLQGLNQAWQLTEGYPPTVDHGSSCHFEGTCVDIGFTGAITNASARKLIGDAQAAGLFVVNESGKSVDQKTFKTTDGAHLHVRLK